MTPRGKRWSSDKPVLDPTAPALGAKKALLGGILLRGSGFQLLTWEKRGMHVSTAIRVFPCLRRGECRPEARETRMPRTLASFAPERRKRKRAPDPMQVTALARGPPPQETLHALGQPPTTEPDKRERRRRGRKGGAYPGPRLRRRSSTTPTIGAVVRRCQH